MRFVPLVIVLVCVVFPSQGQKPPKVRDACYRVHCKAGRECKIQPDGSGQCECIERCPPHVAPVCGTDARSYHNYCLLHRHSCLTNTHIAVKHKGQCKNSEDLIPVKKDTSYFAPELPEIKPASHTASKSSFLRPIVCLRQDRDVLRNHLITVYTQEAGDTHRYKHFLWAMFHACDTTEDRHLDTNEFLECVKDHSSIVGGGKNSELVKALCIDAIIDAVDHDSDWKVNFDEFAKALDSDFFITKKPCHLDQQEYDDGDETATNCTTCVCASGNWVCSSSGCQSPTNHQNQVESVSGEVKSRPYNELGGIRNSQSERRKPQLRSGVMDRSFRQRPGEDSEADAQWDFIRNF